MASRSRRGFYALLLLLTGCFSAGGGSCELVPPNGLAGNGSFHYECVGEGSDPECGDRTLTLGGQLPTRPIARTASFRLTFLDDDTKTVQAASTNAVSGSGTFTAQRAGTIGFFVEARNGTTDIEDAVRLTVADPDSVRISVMGGAVFGQKFVIGAEERFRVNAFERQAPLVGALSATWEIEPEGIVELETSRFGICTLRALAPGKVRLTVKAAGLSDSIFVDVAEPVLDVDGGADASDDGSTDANTDANTDGGATDASQD